MWFPACVFLVTSSLVCTTSASHRNYLAYDTAAHYPSLHKGFISHWDHLSPASDSELSAWTDSLPAQTFGEKSSAESVENDLNREVELLSEEEEEDIPKKKKRESHSLSIVNPLDVLRQRLMLEMARRRMKENQEQIRENAVILKNLGKRSSKSGKIAILPIRRIPGSNSDEYEV